MSTQINCNGSGKGAPVKSEMIKAIADSGDRMPKKSTYFYPKMPAGLVFYKFDAG